MRAVLTAIAPASLLLAGCATTPAITGLPPADVFAKAETVPVGTANEDAADDPAIWRNPADPAASLIVATDKKAGLLVYNLEGEQLFSESSGQLNNVDLTQLDDGRVIVVASNRNDPANARLNVWQLNTATGALLPMGEVAGGTGEGYGLCVLGQGDHLLAYSVLKEGPIAEFRLNFADNSVTATPLRQMAVQTQPEGCVLDARDGTLYVGEEMAGIWRFAPGSTDGELVAPIDNRYLVADVEGLAIRTRGMNGGYLVASSQGDNAYAVYRLPDMQPLGRFAIAAGAFGATEETDGIDLIAGDFGPNYPDGLFVAQDGVNGASAQNFKLVSWADVKAALQLD